MSVQKCWLCLCHGFPKSHFSWLGTPSFSSLAVVGAHEHCHRISLFLYLFFKSSIRLSLLISFMGWGFCSRFTPKSWSPEAQQSWRRVGIFHHLPSKWLLPEVHDKHSSPYRLCSHIAVNRAISGAKAIHAWRRVWQSTRGWGLMQWWGGCHFIAIVGPRNQPA